MSTLQAYCQTCSCWWQNLEQLTRGADIASSGALFAAAAATATAVVAVLAGQDSRNQHEDGYKGFHPKSSGLCEKTDSRKTSTRKV